MIWDLLRDMRRCLGALKMFDSTSMLYFVFGGCPSAVALEGSRQPARHSRQRFVVSFFIATRADRDHTTASFFGPRLGACVHTHAESHVRKDVPPARRPPRLRSRSIRSRPRRSQTP